ncbi:MAG: trigger factor [Betaproteobacteria bacterium RIFCSPLOWO2_02_FULL_62_17]|nr:MAG: trigger factor [Betaproteobacteria bacterium RIFCSPLOWO2_02_FULL_62_17]
MQTNLETLSQLERRLTMAVPAQEIDKEIEERLKKLSRTVRMHGFRPGKVPLKIVAQQYGPQVRSEVIGDAVQKAFDRAVEENKLRVAGNPRIEPNVVEDTSQLSFAATFEVYPELKLGDISGVRLEKPVLAVNDADVVRTLEVLRKQRVAYVPAERAAQAQDRVTVDFTGRIDGAEFAGGKGSDVQVVLGEGRMLEGFESNITGMVAGQSKTFEVKFPENYGNKDLAGKTASFEVKASKVEAPVLPALDAEFAKALGVADGDTEKMRIEVRANVEREVKKRIEADIKQKAMQALLDSTQLELPKSLVAMEMQRLVQSTRSDLEARGVKLDQLPINPELFEAQAKRRVGLGLIIGELVSAKQLAPKDEQIRTLVEDYAQTYEQPGEMVRWLYSERQRLAEFEGLAIESNVVAWVLQNAKVEEKAVSFDEFMNKAAA